MTPAKQLKLINRLLPLTFNLEENYNILVAMELDEREIQRVFKGESVYIWDEITNPFDKTRHDIRHATIEICSDSKSAKPTVTIDKTDIASYFKNLDDDAIAKLSPSALLEDNKRLRESLKMEKEHSKILEESIKTHRQIIELLEKEAEKRKAKE